MILTNDSWVEKSLSWRVSRKLSCNRVWQTEASNWKASQRPLLEKSHLGISGRQTRLQYVTRMLVKERDREKDRSLDTRTRIIPCTAFPLWTKIPFALLSCGTYRRNSKAGGKVCGSKMDRSEVSKRLLYYSNRQSNYATSKNNWRKTGKKYSRTLPVSEIITLGNHWSARTRDGKKRR